MVDNTLSPHGGRLIQRIVEDRDRAASMIKGLDKYPLSDQLAREVVDIAYGIFSPLEGFMNHEDLIGVIQKRELASGYVWPIPITFDINKDQLRRLRLKEGDDLLLTHQGQPFAILHLEELYTHHQKEVAEKVYGTGDVNHPGVARTLAYQNFFIGGKIDLINPPRINPPFNRFWYPPAKMRDAFKQKGWKTVIAHQTRNVPHTGHEFLMKGASYGADGVLVNAVIGEKKIGDYIDEAIVEAHEAISTAGYIKPERHMVSIVFWDMRYAGPIEGIFHALIRKNFGCTHHMYGRDHAGVGKYYSPYAAHEIFREIPDIGIDPVLLYEYWYCPKCEEVAYEGLCAHTKERQLFSGTLIRSIIMEGLKPPSKIFRPEVFDVVMKCEREYGSPFVTEEYLKGRMPIWTVPSLG